MYSAKKETVTMLLAGGQGTRLGVLTRDIAKPAVPFGGKYRIIDFPLSNCINSGMDTIGVLTQYQPFDLNQYIGNGQPWDLDRLNGGVFILPPYVKGKSGEWYKGTANAIYQNIEFIDRYDADYVLILSGDHIYKMDYSLMLKAHKEKHSDCTIAVIDVPLKEASRFGIMSVNKNNKITEFEEKPQKPKSTKASMGIYIFNWKVLKKYLIEDEENKKSNNDFGKDIIPKMLADKQNLYAFSFEGYWKDVGTISSLWQSNMDLLSKDKKNSLDLINKWKIYARNTAEPPHFVGKNGKITNSIVTEGCLINGSVLNSVLSQSCVVEKGAVVENSVILPGAFIGENAVIKYSIVGEGGVVEAGAVVGSSQSGPEDGEWKIAVVGPKAVIKKQSVVKAGEMVEGGKQ